MCVCVCVCMCVHVRVCLCEPPGAEVSHMLPTSEESFTHKAEFSDTKFTVKKKKKKKLHSA